MEFKDVLAKIDGFMSLVYKYELHAFALIAAGSGLCLLGMKDIGFSIITTGCTIFKNKFGG
jgi:hypothetical protein